MRRVVAVIGGAGSLGKNLCRMALDSGFRILAVDSDENRLALLCRCFPPTEGHLLDVRDTAGVLSLVKRTGVTTIVNCAARKHVGWCEQNAQDAVEINAMASMALTAALADAMPQCRYVYIGTDKSVNPICSYAMSKLLGERDALNRGHSVVRGVNFLFSGGSVLDIWQSQLAAGVAFTVVTNPDCTRFCMPLNDMAALVWQAVLSGKAGMFYPQHVYRISPKALFDGFCIMAGVTNPPVVEIPLSPGEKVTEDLDFAAAVTVLTDPVAVASLLRKAVVWK